MELTSYLDRILAWHRQHATPVAQFLQPGLAEDEILAQTSHSPFQMPREFVELYRWRNGLPLELVTGDASFFAYHRFLPLDEALSNFEVSYPILKQFYALTDWVLTFQDPAGDGYGVMRTTGKGMSGQVAFLFEGEGVQVVFDSLTAMMKTVVTCFEEDVFTWRGDEMRTDFYRWGEVAYRLNPHLGYWKQYRRYRRPG